ncbi:MAG: hypothetical protein ABII22_02700 [Candidatus Micrarchaeota archaeon]
MQYRYFCLLLIVLVFFGCTSNIPAKQGNGQDNVTVQNISENGETMTAKQHMAKEDYLKIGKVVNNIPEFPGQKMLEIYKKTEFKFKPFAKKLVESPYSNTSCAYYVAIEYDDSDPEARQHINTQVSDNEFFVEYDSYWIEPDVVKLEVYDGEKFTYSLEPIITKKGKKTYEEYCIVPGREYMLRIFAYGSSYEGDGGVVSRQNFHFYISDQKYDGKKMVKEVSTEVESTSRT